MIEFVPSTDGVSVALRHLGGNGPLLIMSHATGFHGACWTPVAEQISDRFRCVALDYRGHGATVTPPGTSLHWSSVVDDLIAVLDHLSVEAGEVSVAGHSMGGCIALLAGGKRPGLWRSGWLYEPIVIPGPSRPPQPGENPLVEGARRRRSSFESRAAVKERYASKPPFMGTDQRFLDSYVEHGFNDCPDGTVELACAPESEAAIFEGSFCDATAALPAITCPMTVVASGDGMPPAMIAPGVAEALPAGELVRMDHLDHFGPFRDPDAIGEHVSQVLQTD